MLEGGSAFISVSASTPPSQPLTINYSITGKAAFGSDFMLSGGTPGQVVIPAGQTAAFITFNALLDGLTEKRESVKLKLSPGAGYKLPKGKGGKSITIKITSVQ